jgi:hypothetical protein
MNWYSSAFAMVFLSTCLRAAPPDIPSFASQERSGASAADDLRRLAERDPQMWECCSPACLSDAERSLPPDGIYPRGRKLAFMGYSGEPARDLANGFTMAGPVYGDQRPYLQRCFEHGWPVVAHIGAKVTFNDKDPAKYKLDPQGLRQEIERQVQDLAGHKEIRAWVRHDVYLGMASGAKGVLIWSLFKRKEAKRTWQIWYDAYSECARELNGPPALAQVFLFGERKSTLKVEPIDGSAVASVALGGDAESTTTTDQERASRQVKLPSWTSAEFAYRGSRYLFLVNSANAPAAFSVGGTPVDTGLEDVFTGAAVTPRRGEPLRFDLPAYGVTGVRMTLTEEGNPR